MTIRNRAPRRSRLFTTTLFSQTIVAGNIGTASQQSNNQATSDFESKSGRTARGVTIARIWIRALYHTIAVITTPVISSYYLGMGIFTSGIDNGDFPDLSQHDGDWMVHDARPLIDTAVSTDPNVLNPEGAGNYGGVVSIDNRSMRKLNRDTEQLFLVLQKSTVTEDNIQFRGEVTIMWLLP